MLISERIANTLKVVLLGTIFTTGCVYKQPVPQFPFPLDPPKTVKLDCDAGGSLAGALESVGPGDTVLASGNCKGDAAIAVVRVPGVTLDGQGIATLDGQGAAAPVVTFDGAKGVIFKNFKEVTNGQTGALIQRGADVTIHGVNFSKNSRHGVHVTRNSNLRIGTTDVRLPNCEPQQEGKQAGLTGKSCHGGGGFHKVGGLSAHRNSQNFLKSLHETTPAPVCSLMSATGSAGDGIRVSFDSTATIIGAAGFQATDVLCLNNNALAGLSVGQGSSLYIAGATVLSHSNGGSGISLNAGTAYIYLQSIVQTSHNVSNGFSVLQGSTVVFYGPNSISSSQNAGSGMLVQTSLVACSPADTLNLAANTVPHVASPIYGCTLIP